MNDKKDLAVILAGHFPVVNIQSHEEMRVVGLLSDIALNQARPLLFWSVTDGLRLDRKGQGGDAIDWEHVSYDGQGGDRTTDSIDPETMLVRVQQMRDRPIIVLLDFHPYMDEPRTVRLLKEIAIRHPDNGISIVFLSHALELPGELQRLAAAFEMSLPVTAQIKRLIRDEVRIWAMRNDNRKLRGDKDAYEKLAQVLTGLTVSDVKRLLRNAIYDDGAITHSDIPELMQAKYGLISQGGLLSFEYETARFSEVGGFSRLNGWLDLRKSAFLAGVDGPLDPPRGILLLGVQGGGKSLAAKAVAGAWGLPLLRLDLGALYNKYIGETEKNIRQSLQTAEAMSPCVLWIDEIEKSIATGEGNEGTSRRVLATLLTWMAEHSRQVFIVATANDVRSLPPELIRKGRLDEVFFVDLPTPEVRQDIFRIHLNKRNVDHSSVDLPGLAAVADGFSGAEIEQAVVSALYAAHGAGMPVNTQIITAELGRTRPLSVLMAEKVAALREWADGRTVSA